MFGTMSQRPIQPQTLPPLQNLPSWSRNTLGRGKVSKPIVKDRIKPTEKKSSTNFVSVIEREKEDTVNNFLPRKSVSTNRIVSAPSPGKDVDPYQRIVHLEKGIQFLKAQHGDILGRLHKEMEKLKAENKDLTFKLVMAKSEAQLNRKGSAKLVPVNPQQQTSGVGQSSDSKVCQLEEQIRELKVALESSEAKNLELTQSLQVQRQLTGTTRAIRVKTRSGGKKDVDKNTTNSQQIEDIHIPVREMSIPAISRERSQTAESSLPTFERSLTMDSNAEILLQVNINPDSSIEVHLPAESPRPPTLVECQAIIKHLQQMNENRSKDLLSMKTNLKEVLSSGDWTSDAYRELITVINEEDEMSPRGPSNTRQSTRRTPVHFPALVPNVGTNIADRRRRTQALQRSRKKDLY